MNKIKKIAGINLLIMLLYMILLFSFFFLIKGNVKGYSSLERLLFPFLVVVSHTVLLAVASIVSFIQRETQLGQAYLLSAVLVLVIGFSPCWVLLLFA